MESVALEMISLARREIREVTESMKKYQDDMNIIRDHINQLKEENDKKTKIINKTFSYLLEKVASTSGTEKRAYQEIGDMIDQFVKEEGLRK